MAITVGKVLPGGTILQKFYLVAQLQMAIRTASLMQLWLNLVIVVLSYLKYLSDTKPNFEGYTSNVVMVTTDLVRFPDNDNVGRTCYRKQG